MWTHCHQDVCLLLGLYDIYLKQNKAAVTETSAISTGQRRLQKATNTRPEAGLGVKPVITENTATHPLPSTSLSVHFCFSPPGHSLEPQSETSYERSVKRCLPPPLRAAFLAELGRSSIAPLPGLRCFVQTLCAHLWTGEHLCRRHRKGDKRRLNKVKSTKIVTVKYNLIRLS